MKTQNILWIIIVGSLIFACSEKRERSDNFSVVGLSFTEGTWEYNHNDIETISKFWVTFKNSTTRELSYIKFRISIYINKNSENKEIFRRTIEKNEKIYSGDILRFEIEELKDFYTGVRVNNENNITWDAVVLEAK